jgi:hypothetical protein
MLQLHTSANATGALWLATDDVSIQLGLPPAPRQRQRQAVIDLRPFFELANVPEVA